MKKSAFTLIELLVVIAIIAILAAILIPSINDAFKKSKMTAVVGSGKSIYQSLLVAANSDGDMFPLSTGPASYKNSTDYWRWIVTNQLVDATFALFSAPGLTPYNGIDPNVFTEANNAWCISADMARGRNDAPLLFTRNLGISKLSDPAADRLTDQLPFGQDGIIVVTRGGSAFIVKQAELATRFNTVHASNTVLRPETGS